MYVCACVLKCDVEVFDSKKYTESSRLKAVSKVLEAVEDYELRSSTNVDIDRYGIETVWRDLVTKAAQTLRQRTGISRIIIDGDRVPSELLGAESLVRADQYVKAVSAASVIAKVARDTLMIQEGEKYPQYDFVHNKGYGSPKHIEALRQFGPCPIHRQTFLRNLLKPQ
jgi:ribonuclease HII